MRYLEVLNGLCSVLSPHATRRALLLPAAFALALGAAGTAHASAVDDGLAALEEERFEDALGHFNAGFESGEADAGFYLARMAELGLGVSPDPEAARVLFLAAADAGSARALNRVGLMHFRGEGVLQDFETARALICEAAEAGDRDALFNCAGMLAEGLGLADDEDPQEAAGRAFEHYREAAEAGHIGAMNALAYAHLDGAIADASLDAATAHFERAAALGNPVALFELGALHEVGALGEIDLVAAHKHYNLAAARRHPDAGAALARVTDQLTSEQLRTAQRAARDWSPEQAESARSSVASDEIPTIE
jgi:TPR repeat protein